MAYDHVAGGDAASGPAVASPADGAAGLSESGARPILELAHLKKRFPLKDKTVHVLEDVSLSVRPGEFISLVGASGCGKSTILKLIMALDEPTAGTISIDGAPVSKPSPLCSMIFQESRLLPWLSVAGNIDFTIPRSIDAERRRELVRRHIELVGLSGFENALPSQLSGGMQQRVSIARGLATNPKLLLLDEPFGALDAFTRINLQNETLRIWEQEHTTMLLVTHDIDEAIYLSDRIVVLSDKPGTVRSIINVTLPRPRDRSSLDFMDVRRSVMLALFQRPEDKEIEFYI